MRVLSERKDNILIKKHKITVFNLFRDDQRSESVFLIIRGVTVNSLLVTGTEVIVEGFLNTFYRLIFLKKCWQKMRLNGNPASPLRLLWHRWEVL